MDKVKKDWLVRTRGGEVLGPFTQVELVQELHNALFSHDDEIATSAGSWVSANTLLNRSIDDFTNTSTRNPIEGTHTGTLTPTPQYFGSDLTPTPKATDDDIFIKKTSYQISRTRSPFRSKTGPIIAGAALVFGILALILQIRPMKEGKGNAALPVPAAAQDAESPFVKEIYRWIQAGETKTALQQLNQYHEKKQGKGDLEYLIPYAALLIYEKESTVRAKNFLNQIVTSSASPRLKSRAHHWLGYLLLSQDEGDMGESHFLESLQLNPKDAAARFNLGRAYLKQEKFSQALDYLQLAELEIPDLWLIHIYKGRAKVSLGNMEEARQSFKTAVQLSPDRWISYVYYALFLMGIHENSSAQNTLKKMLTRDPQYEVQTPAPWGFYQEKTNYNEYLNAFTHVMEKAAPDERELGKLYLNYLLHGPESHEAKRIEALSAKGGLTAKIMALKVLLDQDTRPENLKGNLDHMPMNLTEFGYYAYVLRGEAKARLKQFNEAQQDFQRALVLDPNAAIAHYSLAKLFQRADKLEEAEKETKTLITLHPQYIPGLLMLKQF